jgi:hypothetical protein
MKFISLSCSIPDFKETDVPLVQFLHTFSVKFRKMKRLIIMMLAAALFMPFMQSSAGIPQGVIDNIAASIRAGNYKALSGYFGNAVEVELPGKEGTFSKSQAEMLLKDFFAKELPASFTVNQKGSSSGGSMFMIGTYKSANGVFRTYLLLKPVSQQLTIQQIQFEKD